MSDELPFELRSLEVFLAACEAGSMAGAARSLGMSQPAVSLSIADLERKTGTTLFDRSVRPMALTLAGGMLRQRASALVADARQIAPLLRETKRGKRSPRSRRARRFAEPRANRAAVGLSGRPAPTRCRSVPA